MLNHAPILVTKSELAKNLNCDPRSQILANLRPDAYLQQGKRRVELFSLAIPASLVVNASQDKK